MSRGGEATLGQTSRHNDSSQQVLVGLVCWCVCLYFFFGWEDSEVTVEWMATSSVSAAKAGCVLHLLFWFS